MLSSAADYYSDYYFEVILGTTWIYSMMLFGYGGVYALVVKKKKLDSVEKFEIRMGMVHDENMDSG